MRGRLVLREAITKNDADGQHLPDAATAAIVRKPLNGDVVQMEPGRYVMPAVYIMPNSPGSNRESTRTPMSEAPICVPRRANGQTLSLFALFFCNLCTTGRPLMDYGFYD